MCSHCSIFLCYMFVEISISGVMFLLMHCVFVKPGKKFNFFLKNGKTVILVGNLEIF